jgi:hypothetical protein
MDYVGIRFDVLMVEEWIIFFSNQIHTPYVISISRLSKTCSYPWEEDSNEVSQNRKRENYW